MSNHHASPPFIARTIRRLSLPVVLIWLALAAVSNALVPQLEAVGKAHTVAENSPDAASLQASKRIGKVFGEFDSDAVAMIVLEGDKPLADDAHRYYDGLLKKLEQDTKHVEHIQDFWGDPLTASASQSNDGKAAYVQLYLRGDLGQTQANESVDAVRDVVDHTPAPAGVKAYVTGPAPLMADQFDVGSRGSLKVTIITFGVIAIMLFVVYRSVVTTGLVLFIVFVELGAARGIVAFLGNTEIIVLSTYATNLLTLLAIAAGTDYAIFFVGRYQEARHRGQDREEAFYTMFRGTAHVILGSGLTIAGAVACLSFTRLPYFQTLGIPAAIGVLIGLVGALTLGPAVLTIASHFGLFEPKRKMQTRGWRRIGTAIVRWPAPILVATIAIALIGLLALPGYKTSYDARLYLPPDTAANVGYAVAERHFSQARLNPELLMVETDHDMRNPADMLVLDRVAKGVFHTKGIDRVQTITRPLGTPIQHSSIPFQISAQSAGQIENLKYQKDRVGDLLKQANEITKTLDTLNRQYAATKDLSVTSHDLAAKFHDTITTVNDLRDKVANFDDFFRPMRNYFYWEPHCFDIPVCAAFRSVFDAIDGVDALSDQLSAVTTDFDKTDAVQQKLLALLPSQISTQQTLRKLTLANYATNSGINSQSEALLQNATAMGQAFDAANNDDFFYLPPEAFDNDEFKRGLKLFLSPDGKAARMIITHKGDPATPQGISHIDPIMDAAQEAAKGTPLENANFYLAGTAATYKDIRDGAQYDLMIAAIAALALILIIMLVITRSLVAALVIVGTVALSLGASFGLSVLVWQDLFGINLYWITLALAVILLLAVGSDYNLLLISRFGEEIGAGLKTGIIRSMAGTGGVVTAAGLVFAATMSSFIFSDLLVLGQIGTTIGLGLLFDTLIVRSFMTPSIAALLGRWFWWPLRVRPRPASEMLRPYGPRRVVRALLGDNRD
jgi:RND superfamily putative drug exporter